MTDLTNKQRQVLDAIAALTDENGYPPTVREVQERLGKTSPSTAHTHLRHLRDKGYIEWKEGKCRSIRIVRNG